MYAEGQFSLPALHCPVGSAASGWSCCGYYSKYIGLLAAIYSLSTTVPLKKIEYGFGHIKRIAPLYPIFYLLRGDCTPAGTDARVVVAVATRASAWIVLHVTTKSYMWGFPKLRSTFMRVPIISHDKDYRILGYIFGSSLFSGNHHVSGSGILSGHRQRSQGVSSMSIMGLAFQWGTPPRKRGRIMSISGLAVQWIIVKGRA